MREPRGIEFAQMAAQFDNLPTESGVASNAA